MVDFTPLKLAYENELDPTKRAFLKLLFEIMEAGNIDHGERLYNEGKYDDIMGFMGSQAFEMVMEDLHLEREREWKKRRKRKMCGRWFAGYQLCPRTKPYL